MEAVGEKEKVSAGNKYGAKKSVADGITFDSRREMERYYELKLLQQGRAISGLKLQPRFELIPKQDRAKRIGERGLVYWQEGEPAVHYTADFEYYENGLHIVEDVKGVRTRDYVLRRKLFKQKYPEIIFRETVT